MAVTGLKHVLGPLLLLPSPKGVQLGWRVQPAPGRDLSTFMAPTIFLLAQIRSDFALLVKIR